MLQALPKGQTYQGFSEAANAGHVISAQAGSSTGPVPNMVLAEDDPERYAFFDHSPFIGLANPLSPPMSLDYSADRVVGRVTFGSAYEGPPGCVHGGYVAGCVRRAARRDAVAVGDPGDDRAPGGGLPLADPAQRAAGMEAWLDRREGRKIWARGTLTAGGELWAEAEGLFIAFDPEKFRALLAARNIQD